MAILAAAVAARAALLAFGQWQDANMEVKYTDIDYVVYTDAAQCVLRGGSPYDRETYRYTPLLAWALTPNLTLHPAFGKVLFCVADIVAAKLLQVLLARQGTTARTQILCLAVWLFSPFTATISTRGNGEALVTCMLLGMLACLQRGDIVPAGALYGLAVHWRLYPIIYALPLVRHLALRSQAAVQSCAARKKGPTGGAASASGGAELALRQLAGSIISPAGVAFGFTAAAVFLALGGAMYGMYRMPFLHETYLYHATRTDPRHNFSPYFYPAYLAGRHGSAGAGGSVPGWGAIAAFAHRCAGLIGDSGRAFTAAQAALQIALGWRFAGDLPLCLLLQTVALVAFNKVSTAQYFVWYLSFLPLLLPRLAAAPNKRQLAVAAAAWCAALGHWLAWAYQLEFAGQPVHAAVWGAGLIFMGAHVLVLSELVVAGQVPSTAAAAQLARS